MSWYTKAQDISFMLTKTIAQWLVQAYRGPIDVKQLHQDLNSLMPSIDDENSLSSAVVAGENQARAMTKQTGDLTVAQQNILDEIRKRLLNPQGEIGLNNVLQEDTQQDQGPHFEQGESYVENY